ncbi:MAG: polysaccharide deacetylase family protein [Mucilaginibacter polytrichastri]|nr:polysaccharide deacetylase family protein [Mucilaginibacter polytrichastri]
MEKNFTVVMYHYVRDLKHTRYPQIKGLDTELFKEQVVYLQKHYNLITVEELIGAYCSGADLPPRAALLTFDDGYADHFTNVLPVLRKKGISGAFFPPVKAIKEHQILDVNKIHFILASAPDIHMLMKEVQKCLKNYENEYLLLSFDDYFKKLAVSNRFDTKEVIFIKRLLQVELPETLRQIITDDLFEKIVSVDQAAFSRELYMSTEQLEHMLSCGMHIGSHGYDHYWLGSLSREDQRAEITKSLSFLEEIGVDINNWTMCYPYGNYNQETLSLLAEFKCRLGFTTKVDIASLNGNYSHFEIPRLDTNDLPKSENASVDLWYEKAAGKNRI